MSCIVTPKPPALHAPCMRALAPSYDNLLYGSDFQVLCTAGHRCSAIGRYSIS